MTTYIIAPAEKDSSHGIKKVSWLARKKPRTANIGSTIPLNVPKTNALFLLFKVLCIGRATASPSGKFWSAIPIAINRAGTKFCVVAKAEPKAKPTAKPSGILWL